MAVITKRRNTILFLLKKKKRRSAKPCNHRYDFYKLQRFQRMAFVFIMTMMYNAFISTCYKERTLWCKERSKEFWNRTVNVLFTERDWIENFRMRKETFRYLCNQLRPYIEKQHTHLRDPISVEQRLAIALWYLSTETGYRTIAWLFGVSKASVCIIVREVSVVFHDVLKNRMIKLPEGEQLNQTIAGFELQWGFPQCFGAIDGSHIPVTPPSDCRTDYYNRKGHYSIILQGLVDHRYLFTNIYVGWPGKVHDARVFRNSSIFRKGSTSTLVERRDRNINGVNVPLAIIADAAYPLLPWLMKPFTDNGRLTDNQKHFNYRLSRARMVVENAFGRLKGRWRVLLKKTEIEVDMVPKMVTACCVLHNLCELLGEDFQDEWLNGVQNDNIQNNNNIQRDRMTPQNKYETLL